MQVAVIVALLVIMAMLFFIGIEQSHTIAKYEQQLMDSYKKGKK